MPLEVISGEDVWLKHISKNKLKRWPARQKAERLYPIAMPKASCTFQIQPSDRIFCIGSCFAREIEISLKNRGYTVLSMISALPQSSLRTISDAGMFNKYNVATIYNELAWALDTLNPYQHDRVLVEVGSGLFQDYQLAGQTYTDELKAMQSFREAFNIGFSAIKEADIVVLTLGLSEVWFDTKTMLYLNMTVPADVVSRYPGRFELHVFDYSQTLAYLEAIYVVLKTHLKPDFRLLVTVSPIPLFNTFRQQDVLVANAYSKALLRTVVDAYIKDKDNVDYFPSYEFVTLSNPTTVWRGDDFRHVDSHFINYIVANVLESYTETDCETISTSSQFLKAKSLYYGNFLVEAKALLKPMFKQKSKSDKAFLVLWSSVQMGLKGNYMFFLLKILGYIEREGWPSFFGRFSELWLLLVMPNKKSYIGHVDSWDGCRLSGWACNLKQSKSLKIKIFSGNQHLLTVLADNPRPDVAEIYGEKYLFSGFYVSLEAFNLQNKTLHIFFANTNHQLKNSPAIWNGLSSMDQ